jgi:hypothetical protein
MRTYYPSLPSIEQQTRQLEHEHCAHCKQAHQLVSHGFVRRKRVGGEPEAIGKRVFCSNRNNRMGCGRTMQLYLESTIRYLHHAGERVVYFAGQRMGGATALMWSPMRACVFRQRLGTNMIKSTFGLTTLTSKWKTATNLAKIVRWQFGREYDGSEARQTCCRDLASP